MSTSRIDELRSKFDENPRRYFAPLANEYRKAGDLSAAIALCREHLPNQPGHMSGHIVYGQALFDAGALDEAQQVFEAALALDPENVKALQHLGEIARANGDASLARRWYERLLDADPRNDEIAQQLASIFTPPVAVPTVEPVAVESEPGRSNWSETDAASTAERDESFAAALDAATADVTDNDALESGLSTGDPHAIDTSDPDATPHLVQAIDAASVGLDETGTYAEEALDIEFALKLPESGGEPVANADVLPDTFTDPSRETPAVPYDATLLSPLATPDSELRAVEAVSFTSDEGQVIDDAFADVDHEAVPDGFAASHTIGATERAESFGLDEEPIDIGNALEAFDAHDPAVELDPDENGEPMALADIEAPPSLAEHDYSEEFEEGLVAPEWPDTSSLLARVEHRPEIDAVTPAYSQDAVDAFGREDVDPDDIVEDDDIEYGEREEVQMSQQESFDDSHDEAQRIDDAPASSAFPPADRTSNVDSVVATDDESVFIEVVHSEIAASPVELPLHDENEEVAGIYDAPAEVQDVARALSRDARASGETEAIRIETHEIEADDDSQSANESSGATRDMVVSFGDVLPTNESYDEIQAANESYDAIQAANESYDEIQAANESYDLMQAANESYDETESRNEQDHGADPEDESHLVQLENEPVVQMQSAASAESPAFVTETMAELLISQGFIERAATVYEELVRRRPFDPVLVSRLAELHERLSSSAPAAEHQEQEADDAEPAFQAAQHVDAEPAEYTAARAGSDANGSGEVEVAHARADRPRTTARELFARLASRRVPRRTPPRAAVAVETPADGLAGLFGSTDEQSSDEYAARVFADAFAPIDEPPFETSENAQVFVTRTITAPSTPAVEPPAPQAQHETTPGANAGFSFDRFFPDPATVASTPPSSPSTNDTPASGKTAPVSDDLAEFAAWLKGLDKP